MLSLSKALLLLNIKGEGVFAVYIVLVPMNKELIMYLICIRSAVKESEEWPSKYSKFFVEV